MISVIVPVYNVEKYVERCIASILAQTYAEFELILVNDGSTDRSREICSKYTQSDQRIKLINKSNGGLSDARNVGCENSTGEYLCFIDSDDFIHPSMLYELWSNLCTYDADISICSFERVRENEDIADCRINELEVLTPEDCYSKIYSRQCDEFTIACAKLYKRELFRGLSYPVGKLHEDEFVTYKLFSRANRIVYTSAKLYYYLQREDSIMHKVFSYRSLVRLDAYAERIAFFVSLNKMQLAGLTSQRYIEKALEYYVAMAESDLDDKEKCKQLRSTSIAYYREYKQFYRYSSLRVRLQVTLFCNHVALFWLHTRYVEAGRALKKMLRKVLLKKDRKADVGACLRKQIEDIT